MPPGPEQPPMPRAAFRAAERKARGSRRDSRRLVGAVILVMGLLGAGAALVVPSADANEVQLAGADGAGVDPFVAGGTVTPAPPPAPNLPTPPPSMKQSGPNAPPTYPGTAPGLYGGTQGVSTCNTAQIISYLEGNPGPAAVWARVPRIPPSAIRSFVTGLTPVILRTDTRVTSYGLRGDRAIPSQVVLQSGTSVLVDQVGVPRVRCGSGNPLDVAQLRRASSPPTYRGTPWPRFAPGTVVIINPTRPIGAIIIVDLGGGTVIIRIPGDLGRDRVITVLPALLRPGDPVAVTGRQFPPGALVTIRYDDPAVVLGTVTADGGGNVATSVLIPANTGPGLHLVTAEGGGAVNVLPVYILPPGA